ncbi:MAG: NAD(P)/FAD-dependent oxidoreductase [Oscillospiraceae bacterium]|nr:NAD(P)/FAD-dependent oxidoreductase [Oscillospiraceae bacterium]
MYKVAIIGAGVIGAMIARELSKYDIGVCILEKENDVAMGTTRANSAIVHAGFDAIPGSLKARFNVRGSNLMEKVAGELGVKYKKNGSLVIGFNDSDRAVLQELFERGNRNGVKDLELICGERLREIEPNISKSAICALYAPTGAIICPYELTIAAVGNAMDNGADLKLGYEVEKIKKTACGYELISGEKKICAEYVINAAGLHSDKIAAMAGDTSFTITPRRGEYILLDKECGNLIRKTVFRTPSEMGKGILVTPTVDGNLLLGPTSENIDDKEDRSTTAEGFSKIIGEARGNIKEIPLNKAITSFCGLRAVGNTGDFIINSPACGFINVAGIESPGLTSAPAIAEYVVEMLRDMGADLIEKKDFNPHRKPMHYFREASIEEKNEIIKKDRAFGKIICRCEEVTEGEILEALRTNPKARDLDGVKRRTRAQMGRCQGGFCSPHIVRLIARELGIKYEEVTKSGGESKINLRKTKGGERI